jgi:hypothetical protein
MNRLVPGDPVKVTGKRGNFRFLGYYKECCAEVVGPIGGDGENAKIVSLDKVKLAPKNVTRKTVAPSQLEIQISQSAHSRGGR